MKIKVVHHTRYGMGYEYYEKYYYCPNCGMKLDWDDIDDN